MGNCCEDRANFKEQEIQEQKTPLLALSNKKLTAKNSKSIKEVYDLHFLYQCKSSDNLVYEAVHKNTNNKFIAKKFIKEGHLMKVLGTIDIMRLCDHQNFVKLIEFFEEEDSIYLILEYYQGGTLYEEMKRRIHISKQFDIEEIRLVAQQLLSAVGYIHKLQIVHKHIVPEYICLIDKKSVEIIKIFHFEQASIKKLEVIDLEVRKKENNIYDQEPPEVKLEIEKASSSYDL